MKLKKRNKIIIQVLGVIIGMIVLLVGISLYTHKDNVKNSSIAEHIFTKRVEQHRPLVTKYAKEYDMEEYIDVILAVMMQESGGRGDDPMQASESKCGEIGCIDNPDDSIKQGVAYFSKMMEATNEDVPLSIQAYNFGLGFVDYAQSKERAFDQEMAIQFSQKKYDEAEDPSQYTCLRKESKEYDACYGDIYYARDVIQYQKKFAKEE
ncbi:MAG TPA: lysozyme family protein [Pseudogracilibacillus sp.]|nr:lysozyme family protein [Pseudogracilibacillus sp.]